MEISNPRVPHGRKCEAIDVVAELRYWKLRLLEQEVHWARLPFPRLEPTLKFAYDVYLLWHREPLDLLGERLENAYERQLLPRDRLDGPTAQAVIAAVWERMGGRLQAASPRTAAAPARTAPWSMPMGSGHHVPPV